MFPCRLAAVLILSAVVLRAEDSLMGWSMQSAGGAIGLVAVKDYGLGCSFVLRNSSGKPITALAVSHGSSGHTIDYFHTGSALAAGAAYSLPIGYAELVLSDRILHVNAVVFADGTYEGLLAEARFIAARRLGRVMETERIKAILAALPAAESGDAAVVQAIRARLGNLPESAAEAIAGLADVHVPGVDSAGVRSLERKLLDRFLVGVRSAREEAGRQLDDIAASPVRGHILADLRMHYAALSAENRKLVDLPPGKAAW